MKEITSQQLLDKLEQDPTVFLIDVRENIEYFSFNVGGLNIPLSELAEKVCTIPLKKNDEIIVVCAKGIRSKSAVEILEKLNFTNVYNVSGGVCEIHKMRCCASS